MPNVLGYSESEARQALDAAGLQVEVSYNPNVEEFRGVFAQSISAGETVEIGKSDYYINRNRCRTDRSTNTTIN